LLCSDSASIAMIENNFAVARFGGSFASWAE
jgi:hypothetical protein